MSTHTALPGLDTALSFPLIEALHGRRARRFSIGAEIPEGPLAFRSGQEPMPLSDLEKMIVLTSAAGNTGWHFAISRTLPTLPTSRLLGCGGWPNVPLGGRLSHVRGLLRR
jgi:hypothetical protein